MSKTKRDLDQPSFIDEVDSQTKVSQCGCDCKWATAAPCQRSSCDKSLCWNACCRNVCASGICADTTSNGNYF